MSSLLPTALSYQLLAAAQVVVLVKQGTALPQALAQHTHAAAIPAVARGAVQDIAYRTMRNMGLAEALLRLLAQQPPKPILLHTLLCCALTLVSEATPAYEHFTVVDQAVTAAAGHRALRPAKNMVNAILRRFLREESTLRAQLASDVVAQWNYPLWWIRATQTAYPTQWQTILAVGNTPPPLTLRINQRLTTMADYLQTLAQENIAAQPLSDTALHILQPIPVQALPGFSAGWVSVQDAAAQYAAPLLDVQDGMRVLDACAAPGGKTCHILEQANVDLLALDCDAKRLEKLQDNLTRLQLSASIKTGDASRQDWWDGQLFDRIVADVPCTASGIVRRHPDIRWLRRPDDAAQLATISAKILDNLWQMVKPGGKLLFITCSLWPEESAEQARTFALRNHALTCAAPGQLLPTALTTSNHDGLFFALFQK